MKAVPTIFSLVVTLGALAAVPARADDTGTAPAAETKHAEAEWLADFDKAVEAAKAQKKDILVDFTGSDWCGWCKKLHAEVFAQPEFVAEAPKSFILCALDFPRAPEIVAKVPNPARNAELQKKYGVRGFPTILVVNAEGQVLVQTGYRPGGAKPYLEHLSSEHAAGKEALVKVAQIEKDFAAATGDAKHAVAKQALDLWEAREGAGPASALLPLLRQIPALDAGNAQGLSIRALKAVVGSGNADDAALADARAADPKNEHGLLESVVMAGLQKIRRDSPDDVLKASLAEALALAATGNLKDPQTGTNVHASAINIAMKLKDTESAKTLAAFLKEKGPKDNPRLTKFLDSVLNPPAPPEGPAAPGTPK